MKNSNYQDAGWSQNQQQDNQLSNEWDLLSKRLTQVQKGLTILSKKHSKLEKKLTANTQQAIQFNTELTQQLLRIKSSIPTGEDLKEDFLKNCQLIQNEIKNSCSQSISIRFEELNLSVQQRNNSVQVKIRSIYDQTKSYVDRAVFQLKQLLKKYVKQQGELQRKVQRSSRQNSPSMLPKTLTKSTSSKKLQQTGQKSQASEKYMESSSNNWFDKSRTSLNRQSVASASGTRVSYLRQKLKQFQKINKKYQGQPQKVNNNKQQKQDIVKKMKNYREYLQQSESQLEPSNLFSQQQVKELVHTKKNNYSLF